MKLLIALLALVVLAGCATMTLENKDGVCTVEYKTLFKNPKTMTFEACEAKGTYEGGTFFSLFPEKSEEK